MRHSFVVVGSLLALAATGGVTALGGWSVLVAIAWAVTMVAPVVMANALRRGDGEAAMRAAMAPAAAVLPIALLALLQLGATLLAEPARYHCGGPVPPHVVALGFAAGGALFAYQAPALTPRHGAARGWLVLALAVAFAIVAGVTVARRHAAGRFPAANAWVNARPFVARFAAASANGGRDVACGGGVCVARVCRHGGDGCSVSLVGAQRRPTHIHEAWIDDDHASVLRENAIEVRRVEGGGPVLVREVTRSRSRRLPVAFDARTGERVEFDLGDVKATVAAPPGWIRGGLLGLAFAVSCALVGLLRRKMPRDGWSPAMHHGGGVLRTYAREGRFDGAAGLALGPVFVRSPTESGNAYRDGPSTPITHVIRAVGVDLDRSLAALDLAPFVLALGALFALAAPLIAASLYGLA